MTKKSLGYVRLEWVCPQCETKNPGPNKFCNGCGKPQPPNVEFQQPDQELLLTDEEEILKAKAGPDVHCPYCNARNSNEARFCGQCGGDLASAQVRESGEVVGAHRPGPAEEIRCEACGSMNHPNAARCTHCGASLAAEEIPAADKEPATLRSKFPIALLAILPILLCVGVVVLLILGGRSEDLSGQVSRVQWERTIPVESLVVVEREDWADEIPTGSTILACDYEYHHSQDEPAPNSQEVCGTPYTVDTGSGYGEVVQDCVYEVYEESCTYEALNWQVVDQVTANGDDLSPFWPSVQLTENQREGETEQVYVVFFETDDGELKYEIEDPNLFADFIVGSEWILSVNTFGGIREVEPSR